MHAEAQRDSGAGTLQQRAVGLAQGPPCVVPSGLDMTNAFQDPVYIPGREKREMRTDIHPSSAHLLFVTGGALAIKSWLRKTTGPPLDEIRPWLWCFGLQGCSFPHVLNQS